MTLIKVYIYLCYACYLLSVWMYSVLYEVVVVENIKRERVVILVLGCHMNDILEDRMNTAVDFAKRIDMPITWFLSGGTKNQLDKLSLSKQAEGRTDNEAEKMANWINPENKNWKIELDVKSKNTAENFAYFRSWVEREENVKIYVVTSEFHHLRASSILSGITSINVNWLLSPKACSWCVSDEKIHNKNIHSDIGNALRVYEELNR